MEEEPAILSSIACNLDAAILSAAFPLLEEGQVEAIEWAFDTLFWAEQVPDWFTELLPAYSQQNRLVGHGVYFSPLSGRWSPEQQQWLARLQQVSREFSFDHITEHFGFFTGQNFHYGAPLPTPYTAATLRIGQDRLGRMADTCRCPVGLENLAFAYSLAEVKQQGEFLEKLLEPVNGFLILNLHNLCYQLHNFGVSYEALIALYPLDRVREIHISGGSWEDSAAAPGQQVRRDTHDEAVPAAVFDLLERTLPRCPHLKYVVLEQLGNGLQTTASQEQFRRDFQQIETLVKKYRKGLSARLHHPFVPPRAFVPGPLVEDAVLHAQQQQLSQILETTASFVEARQRLLASALARTDWAVESWEPHMLETALSITQKWKK